MDWYTCSNTFITVVDEKSFAQAARTLYTTQSAISKRIAWLEDRLDAQLLTRTTRRLDLTEVGEKYYNHVLPLLDEWKEIINSINTINKMTVGELRVAVPTIAGNQYLSQLVPKFLSLYPDIKLILLLTNKNTNLLENQIDVYISSQSLGNSTKNISQKIIGPPRKLYASPAYIEKFGEPKSLSALLEHNCLVHTAHTDNHWHFKNESIQVDGNYKSNSADSLIKAAVSSVGIIFVPETFVKDELEKKKLQVIMPQYHSDNIDIYASFPAHKYVPMKAQVFIQFLTNELYTPHH
jgi:DNA-binding transcriptional LysR family regulator